MKPFYFLIAWRNLWRSKKRTLIAVASVGFAVFFAVIMRSSQSGSYDNMIGNVAGIYCGYVRISDDGYTKTPSFENTMKFDENELSKVEGIEKVTHVFPRLESAVLASHDDNTKGVFLMGIDPVRENKDERLSKSIVAGKYFSRDDHSVLLGKGVSDFLQVSVGDTVVLFGQDRYGSIAAGKFPVAGIIKMASPYIDDRVLYLPLKAAQTLFDAEDRLTTVAVMIENQKYTAEIKKEVEHQFSSEYEVKSWNELFPDLEQAIAFDSATGIIMILILYAVVTLGILGTIVMMTLERTREFAMCIAVGMKRWQLAVTTMYESVMISLLGVLCGVLAAMPILIYLFNNPIRFTGKDAEAYKKFNIEPIIPFSLDPSIFINQTLIILVIALIISQYPIVKVFRLNVLSSLRS